MRLQRCVSLSDLGDTAMAELTLIMDYESPCLHFHSPAADFHNPVCPYNNVEHCE